MRDDNKSCRKSKPLKISPRHKDKIYSRTLLQLVWRLWYLEAPERRQAFVRKHRIINRLYEKAIRQIGRRLNLPAKRCVRCGILFVPDYRTEGHQKNCPYGCVEYNRRENREKADIKYRGSKKGRLTASACNRRYRERKKNGDAAEITDPLPDRDGRKMRRYILSVWTRLNAGSTKKKTRQFERIVKKIEKRMKNEMGAISTQQGISDRVRNKSGGRPP